VWSERGAREMATKLVLAPVWKRANIQCDARWTRSRAESMFYGRPSGGGGDVGEGLTGCA